MAALCYEVGADGYVCVGATTRNLIWVDRPGRAGGTNWSARTSG